MSLFQSWHNALIEHQLEPDQLKVLEEMVASGQAESLEAAATMLDWQDSVIQPDEHMYGF